MPNSLSSSTMIELAQAVWQARNTPLNQQTLAQLINFRTLDLAAQEVGRSAVDALGVPSQTRPIARVIKSLTQGKLAAGHSAADPYINTLIREKTNEWTRLLASKEVLNPVAMQTRFYLTAIDQMQNDQLPTAAQEAYAAFTLRGLANMSIKHGKEMLALQEGLAQFAADAAHQASVDRLNAFSASVGGQFQAIAKSVAALREETHLNTRDIDLLKGQVSILEDTVTSHEVRLEDLEMVTYAMFEEFNRVDTLGLDKVSDTIEGLNSEYQLLLAGGASYDAILKKRAELTTAITTLNAGIVKMQGYLGWVDGGAQALTMLGGVLGKPELAQAAQVLQGAAQIGLGLMAAYGSGALSTAAGALVGAGMFGPLAPVIAIVSGIAMIYMSLKSSGDGGGKGIAAALQKISQQIQALSKQIHRLGVHIDNRFDRVEDLVERLFSRQERLLLRGFESLITLLDDFHRSFIEAFTKTQGQLEGVEVLIGMINDKLGRLAQVTEAGFRALYRQRYTDTLLVVTYYDFQKFGSVKKLYEREMRDTMRMLVQWASVDSKNAIVHGDLAADYRIEGLYGISKADWVNSINLLLGFLTSSQGYGLTLSRLALPGNLTKPLTAVNCISAVETARLVNPNAWKEAVKALLHFTLQTPEWTWLPEDKCFVQQMIQAGESFLSTVIGLQTHPVLLLRLLADYQGNLDRSLPLIYFKILERLQSRPNDIVEQGQQAKHQLMLLNNTLSTMFTEIELIGNTLKSLMEFLKSTCSIYLYGDGVRTAFKPDGECYVEVKGLLVRYTPDGVYTNAPNCHDNRHYDTLNAAVNATSFFKNKLLPFQKNISAALSAISSDEVYHVLKLFALEKIFPEGPVSFVQQLAFLSSDFVQNTHAYLDRLFKITACYRFAFYYQSSYHFSIRGKRNHNVGKSLLPQLKSKLDIILDSISKPFNNAHGSLVDRSQAAADSIASLMKKLSDAAHLEANFILDDHQNTTHPLKVGLSAHSTLREKIVWALNQWATQDAVSDDLAKAKEGVVALLSSPEMIAITTQMNHYHHALWLFLSLTFNEAFYSDPIINEIIRSLWTGDQLTQAIQQFNPSNNATFPLLALEESFFPQLDGQSQDLFDIARAYLNQTLQYNLMLAQNGTLAPGYLDIHALLDQLYTLRDVLIPSALPITEPSRTATVVTASKTPADLATKTRAMTLAISSTSTSSHSPSALVTTDKPSSSTKTQPTNTVIATATKTESTHTVTAVTSEKPSADLSRTIPTHPSISREPITTNRHAPTVLPTTAIPATAKEPFADDPNNLDKNSPDISLSFAELGLVLLGVAFVAVVIFSYKKRGRNRYRIGLDDEPVPQRRVQVNNFMETSFVILATVAPLSLAAPVNAALPFARVSADALLGEEAVRLRHTVSGQATYLSDGTPVWLHANKHGTAIVYYTDASAQALMRARPGVGAKPLVEGDHYSNCAPLGSMEVVCYGQQTTLVYRSSLVAPNTHVASWLTDQGLNKAASTVLMQPFSDVTGNLMLCQVLCHLAQKISRYLLQSEKASGVISRASKESIYLPSVSAQAALGVFNGLLCAKALELRQADAEYQGLSWSWAHFAVSELQEDLALLLRNQANLTQASVDGYEKDLSRFSKDLSEAVAHAPWRLRFNEVARLVSHSLFSEKTVGDGDCLYRSIGDKLGYEGAELRVLTAEYLSRNVDAFKPYIPVDQRASYVSNMKAGAWGDYVALLVIQQMTSRTIVVVTPGQRPVLLKGLSVEEPIFIHYNGQYQNRRGHYEALMLKPGHVGAALLASIELVLSSENLVFAKQSVDAYCSANQCLTKEESKQTWTEAFYHMFSHPWFGASANTNTNDCHETIEAGKGIAANDACQQNRKVLTGGRVGFFSQTVNAVTPVTVQNQMACRG